MASDILVVDDEEDIREIVSGILSDEGHETRTAHDADSALAAISDRVPRLVFLDIWMQGSRLDGLSLLDEIKLRHPDLPVVMISGHGNVETAVSAIKRGAFDFIEKPFKADRLILIAERALENSKLKREVSELKRRTGDAIELIGTSVAVSQLRQTIEKIAPTNSRIMIFGPSGSGKSTLAKVLAGHEGYEVVRGEVRFRGEDLLEMEPDERARAGLFLAFQYPMEVPGVTIANFLRLAYQRRFNREVKYTDFYKILLQHLKKLEMDASFASRAVNEGFSGGEKKRFEIVQMSLLEPVLAVLDETDSGLDIDALKVVANGVNSMRSPERAFLIITHYQRILNYITPDYVHVMVDGRIVRSGGPELAVQLEAQGYDWVRSELAGVAQEG